MTETEITIKDILSRLHPGVDFETEKELVSGKILDSFDVVRLVGMLSDEFDIAIKAADLIPENFESLDSMAALVDRCIEES